MREGLLMLAGLRARLIEHQKPRQCVSMFLGGKSFVLMLGPGARSADFGDLTWWRWGRRDVRSHEILRALAEASFGQRLAFCRLVELARVRLLEGAVKHCPK